MTDRAYRAVFGASILLSLYFNLQWLMYLLIGLLFFEGLTNQRIPMLVCRLQSMLLKTNIQYVNTDMLVESRFNLEAERMWRITVGVFLLISYSLVESLWWFPFMGFAIFGAGLSGICPVLLAIRWIGFR